MNNELSLKKRHARHEQRYEATKAHHDYLEHLMVFCKWLTFLLYLAFAIVLYIGDFMNLKAFLDAAAGSIVGFLFYLTICVLLAYTLSGIKHAAYSHMAMFERTFTIIALVIFMGLMAEVFQASGQQDAKARITAESSSEHQALINQANTPTLPPDAGLTLMIAKAEQKLARCEHNVTIGKEPHCNGDRAKVIALKNQVQANHQNQIAIATAQTEARAKRLDEIEKKAHNPTIRAMADFFQWEDIARGIVTMMFIVAVCFELSHYYLSEMKRRTLQELDGLSGAMDRLEIDYSEQAGHSITEDQGINATPQKSDNNPIGFNQPVTAKKSLFKYQEAQPSHNRFIGFQDTNGKNPATLKTEVPKPTATPAIKNRLFDPTKKDVLGSQEQQLDLKAFIDNLPDDPAPHYERYLDKALQTGKANTQEEANRFLNEALNPKTNGRDHSGQHPAISIKTNGRDHSNNAALEGIDPDVLREGHALYSQWKQSVKDKVMSTANRPGRKFISNHLCKGKKKTIAPPGMDVLLSIWCQRGVKEGWLAINPKYTGKPPHTKYVLS